MASLDICCQSKHHEEVYRVVIKRIPVFSLINLCHWSLVFLKFIFVIFTCSFPHQEIANIFHISHFLFSLWILPHISIYFYNLFFGLLELSINEIIWKKLLWHDLTLNIKFWDMFMPIIVHHFILMWLHCRIYQISFMYCWQACWGLCSSLSLLLLYKRNVSWSTAGSGHILKLTLKRQIVFYKHMNL